MECHQPQLNNPFLPTLYLPEPYSPSTCLYTSQNLEIMKGKILISIFLLISFGTIGNISEDAYNVIGNITNITNITSNQIKINCSIEAKIIEKDKYAFIEINDAKYLIRCGYPIIPYETKIFKLPFGTEIKGIDIEVHEIEEIKLEKELLPSPPVVELLPNNLIIKNESYEVYPSEWVMYRAGGGIENGKRLTFLSIFIFPVRYHPLDKKVEIMKRATIKISLNRVTQGIDKDIYDLLILCPDEWKDELETLKQYKEENGIKTVIVTLNNAYKYNGRDSQEKIKYCIKDAVEKWGIKYVLIVGSYNDFPMRKSWVYDESELRYWMDIPIPTDLYYADLYFANGSFSSWDTNNNGYYGEFARKDGNKLLYDRVDLYPDVYIGRIACRNVNEVKTVIDKIINYNPGRWFRRIVCIAGDTVPNDGYGDVDEGIEIVEKSLEYLSGFIPIRLYPSPIIPELRLNPFTIHMAISLGCGFVHFDGHGNMLGWSTHPHNSEEWIGNYASQMITYLWNKYKLPVIRIGGCLCGALDYKKDCFAWNFVKHENGGAIATVAATRLSYGYLGKYCHAGLEGYHGILFFKAYKSGVTPAEMLANAQIEYLNTIPMKYEKDYLYDFKTIEEFILFGDPSLKI